MTSNQNTSRFPIDHDQAVVLQITDTHLLLDPKAKKHGVCPQQTLQEVLDESLAWRVPDLLLATGDIAAEPHPEVYRRFFELVRERYRGPLLCVPGNHDDGETLAACLPTEPVTIQSWRFVGIDTHVDGEVGGSLAPDEFKRLERELRDHEDRIVVVGHHHPIEILSAWMDRHRIVNGDELLHLMASNSNCRAYVFGHVHQIVDRSIGSVRVLGAPSTCWQFLPRVDDFEVEAVQPGWRWLYCNDDGTIETTVERTN